MALMSKMNRDFSVLPVIFLFFLFNPSSLFPAADQTSRQFASRIKPLEEPAKKPLALGSDKEILIADFEGGNLKNNLDGESGSWNIDPDDPNSSVDISIVKDPAADKGNVLKIDYRVDPTGRAQNGFWTKLQNLDASKYDHLQFDIRGDSKSGFTDTFKIELKKYKDVLRIEKIKGISIIQNVKPEWQTIQIPLNKMTGLLNFGDPKVWENPAIGRRDLDEFVIVFESRRASKKSGTIYIDNLKLVNLGKKLPTAVDFPPRKGEKTKVHLEGVDFAKFLAQRLQGYPKQVVVKKKFPEDDRKFLMEIAKDTWRFFDEVVDHEHQLPLDTIQLGEKEPIAKEGFIGDYTNVTNIGLYLMCLVSANDLGFITKEEAVKRISNTFDTIDKLEKHSSGFLYNYYDTTTIERTSFFVSLVDSGWLDAGLYVVKHAYPEELGKRAEKMFSSHSFAFFYDPVEEQMYHGYYDHLQVYSDYHYGSFYTEPRAASFMAIGRGEVPIDHWFRMVRTFPESYSWQTQPPIQRVQKTVLGVTFEDGFYEWKGIRFIPSWGGSVFEALMPGLILDEKGLAPQGLGLNDKRYVDITIQYTLEDLGFPVWGMSPSSVPEGGYSEFGVSVLGSKGYPAGAVTPHASILALDYAPEQVIKNLRELIKRFDIYGEYGFYDAVNVKTGKVARKYLSLDQGMIFVALNNYLNNGAIRKRFHSDEIAKKAEPLLREEKFFEELGTERQPKARPIAKLPSSPGKP